SPDLRARQQQRLARFGERVQWLDTLPTEFIGCVLANEVLDAMPVNVLRRNADACVSELFVARASTDDAAQPEFAWVERPASPRLQAVATDRLPAIAGYQSEINLRAEAWVRHMRSEERR